MKTKLNTKVTLISFMMLYLATANVYGHKIESAVFKQAINASPNSQIVVEGNTDSFGNDSLNLDISQKRSIAVTEYLKANNPKLNITNITSIGNGENKPIANNETANGRLKNRRIDIIIKPSL